MKCMGTLYQKAEGLILNSVGQRPTLERTSFQGCRPCIYSMSPLQGFKFFTFLRRALPYANEWQGFTLLNAKY